MVAVNFASRDPFECQILCWAAIRVQQSNVAGAISTKKLQCSCSAKSFVRWKYIWNFSMFFEFCFVTQTTILFSHKTYFKWHHRNSCNLTQMAKRIELARRRTNKIRQKYWQTKNIQTIKFSCWHENRKHLIQQDKCNSFYFIPTKEKNNIFSLLDA